MQQKWQRTTLHNLLLYKERRTPEWLVRLHTGTERIQEEAGTAKQKLDGHCQMRSEGFGHYQGFSFRGCFRRRILKPMDDIVVSLMKSLQPAGELCLRAVVNDVRHHLPLSALTQVRLSHAPTTEAGTAGTVACPEPSWRRWLIVLLYSSQTAAGQVDSVELRPADCYSSQLWR